MLTFDLSLLNSSNRWASTADDLKALYRCPATGALTIRTSLLNGFDHRDEVHQHCFFDPVQLSGQNPVASPSSLNTLGYSPTSLPSYCEIVKHIEDELVDTVRPAKPVIFSVTGSAAEVAICHNHLVAHAPARGRWLMEVNLSCPNIPGKPPPAYSRRELSEYLQLLQQEDPPIVSIGLKLPPFTYQDQFDTVVGALLDTQHRAGSCPVSFLTSTNTLGSCLVLDESGEPALSSADGSGIGGLAGPALHPLALGNVRRLRSMLDAEPALKEIAIIGTGGVHDRASYERMRAAGAAAVGVGTAFGLEGIDVFGKILAAGAPEQSKHIMGER